MTWTSYSRQLASRRSTLKATPLPRILSGLVASIPLFAVPGVALTVAGVGVVGGVAAAGAAAAAVGGSKEMELKTGVKRGVRVGKATKYVIKVNREKQEIEWEKVGPDSDVLY